MKQIKYFTCGFLIMMSVIFNGCSSDYLDTNPTDKVPDVTAFASLDNLMTSLNGIHRKMVSQDGSTQGLGGEPGFTTARETLGDDMTFQTNVWYKGLHQWSDHRVKTSSYCEIPWRIYYSWILNANLILANVDKYEAEDPDLYKGIKGEALCFRAWAHFQLVQMYAKRYEAGKTNSQPGVIYRKIGTLEPLPRNTVEECYQWMNEDIDEAIKLLEGYDPEKQANAMRANHFTEETAYGIKARIALAQQDYSTAADAATKSLELALEQGYQLMEANQLMHGFSTITTSTNEAVWAAMTKSDQTVYFYSYYAYMSWNYNSTAIRQGVKAIGLGTYELMSETDLRRQWWDPEGGKDDLPASNYTPYPGQNRKFTAKSTSDAVGDYAFMRISELYLMKAEALARSGKNAEAQEVLTEFAVTRDPEYKSSGNTGDALIEEIMTHRRIELWGEGFRWFDLKRLNLPLKRIGDNWKPAFCGVTEVAAGDVKWQYHIPQEEINANPDIIQND